MRSCSFAQTSSFQNTDDRFVRTASCTSGLRIFLRKRAVGWGASSSADDEDVLAPVVLVPFEIGYVFETATGISLSSLRCIEGFLEDLFQMRFQALPRSRVDQRQYLLSGSDRLGKTCAAAGQHHPAQRGN